MPPRLGVADLVPALVAANVHAWTISEAHRCAAILVDFPCDGCALVVWHVGADDLLVTVTQRDVYVVDDGVLLMSGTHDGHHPRWTTRSNLTVTIVALLLER